MNFRPRQRDEPEINLIPFIDVLLVVLIFLMLSTTYSKFTELQLRLPVADTDAQRERFVGNVAGHLLGGVSEPILERAFDYWKSVDADTGKRIEEAVHAGRDEKAPAPGPTDRVGVIEDLTNV